jgi:hypothetical protein
LYGIIILLLRSIEFSLRTTRCGKKSAGTFPESVICAIIGRDKCFVVRYKDRPVPLILFADYIFELARGIKSSHFTFQIEVRTFYH